MVYWLVRFDPHKIVSDLTRRGVTVEFLNNLRFIGEDSPVATLLLSLPGTVAESMPPCYEMIPFLGNPSK